MFVLPFIEKPSFMYGKFKRVGFYIKRQNIVFQENFKCWAEFTLQDG